MLHYKYKFPNELVNCEYDFCGTFNFFPAPNPVTGIITLQDSKNITFEWPRPEGRIDLYTFVWWNALTPDKKV